MESLPDEYENWTFFYFHKHHRHPNSPFENSQAKQEYAQAIKELFCQVWAPHHNVNHELIQVVKKKESFWKDFSVVVADKWLNYEDMIRFFSDILKLNLRVVSSSSAVKPYRQAFESKLSHSSVDYVYAALNNVCCQWGGAKKWYFPGLTLIQSSGMGKSRAVYELAHVHKVYVIDCSFATGAGYPGRSKIANRLLLYKEDDYQKYFYCCLKVLRNKLAENWTPEKLAEDCRDGSDFWGAVVEMMNASGRTQCLSSYLETLPFAQNYPASFTRHVAQVADEILNQEKVQTVRICFVFDEARALLGQTNEDLSMNANAFTSLRGVTSHFPSERGLAVVFLDTVSRISNLAPSAEKDPSARVRSGSLLFPPVYLLRTIDIKADKFIPGLDLKDRLDPAVLYRYGRPLWGDSLDQYSPGKCECVN
jgi:hypothetical protein